MTALKSALAETEASDVARETLRAELAAAKSELAEAARERAAAMSNAAEELEEARAEAADLRTSQIRHIPP